MKCQKGREDTAFQVFFFLVIKLLHHTPGHSGRRGSHRSGAAESGGARTELEFTNWPVPGMRKVGAGRMGKLLEILTRTSKSQFKS